MLWMTDDGGDDVVDGCVDDVGDDDGVIVGRVVVIKIGLFH